ncbi:Protein-glutamine gamma-glutamyltransferase [Trichinella spiralis]|uniref:Protein-glutamine gamma-glutamyltransferase n=1 Tax=Trichinella spiralis TaxID=6334 RepID=A0ABR3KLH7_TRISP
MEEPILYNNAKLLNWKRRRPRQRAQGAVRAEIQQTHCPEVHYRGNLVTAVWVRARPCCARDSPGLHKEEQRQMMVISDSVEATEGPVSKASEDHRQPDRT